MNSTVTNNTAAKTRNLDKAWTLAECRNFCGGKVAFDLRAWTHHRQEHWEGLTTQQTAQASVSPVRLQNDDS
ncbi:hypothetical protein WJX75_001032 [Coccomyxa subellipsoidea]|uniref:C2H2-type domain-containing protein n=1 Tax=Coccomyxa subellipsoidea TaxID=248742 RepID=A0ABR2YXA2_9CHLO